MKGKGKRGKDTLSPVQWRRLWYLILPTYIAYTYKDALPPYGKSFRVGGRLYRACINQ